MMVENKSTIFGIIALIIGATGLGLGVFSVISLQAVEGEQGLPGEDGQDAVDGIDGIDGTDAPGYYCNSAVEVQQALDSIGKGSGKIIITESITLSSTININGGGSYIIQGYGASTVIDCGGNRNAFNIKNATSCKIQDLRIDSSDIYISNLGIININETNDNPIYIENLYIIGDTDKDGYGINIESENVWITACYIKYVTTGIFQTTEGKFCHFYNNRIFDSGFGMEVRGDYNYISGNLLDTGMIYGITIYGAFNMMIGNLIRDCLYGFKVYEGNNTIEDNTILQTSWGIYLYNCSSNIVSGNFILNGGDIAIYITDSNHNIITSNIIDSFSDGVTLLRSNSSLISENHITNGKGDGVYINQGDYNIVSSNLISNMTDDSSNTFAGIHLNNDVDFTVITGNNVFNCINVGPGTGYGIRIIGSGCNENTVIGNTALNNENNWDNSGTDTFGDSTNNNFG